MNHILTTENAFFKRLCPTFGQMCKKKELTNLWVEQRAQRHLIWSSTPVDSFQQKCIVIRTGETERKIVRHWVDGKGNHV